MRVILLWLIIIVLMFLLISAVLTPSQEYKIIWWSIDSGGRSSKGGDYTLNGTIGQHDADTMTGGEFSLAGGISTGEENLHKSEIYLPVMKR